MNSETFIYLGSDHRGFNSKKLVIESFNNSVKYRIIDCGSFDGTTSADYPDYAKKVCSNVLQKKKEGKVAYGILICSSGIGMSMVANRYKNIRCALCSNTEQAKATREHNNSNVLALGCDYITENMLKSIVNTFLKTKFTNEERHIRRILKINS
tara:strand:+ start:24 stop:485 length:462 start_codon:yes stop_codon:yes gene_type:complete